MSFLDTLRKSLTPEMYASVVDQLGDDFDFDLVPRTRLNKVIKQRNELRVQLAGGSQSQNRKTASDEDEDVVDTLPQDIEQIRQQIQAQSDAQIQEIKIQYAALQKLRDAEIIDPEMVWSSDLFNKKEIKLDADGNLIGMDDALAKLKTDKPYLCKAKQADVPTGTGKKEGSDNEPAMTRDNFLKMSVEDQLKFKQSHPEVFKTFL